MWVRPTSCLLVVHLTAVMAGLPAQLNWQAGMLRAVVLHLQDRQVTVSLNRVTGLLAPHFSLVVREAGRLSRNSSAPHPGCLYRGAGPGAVLVAVAVCGDRAEGLAVLDGQSVSLELGAFRTRREAEMAEVRAQPTVSIPGRHQCGLNTENRKKMMVADERPVVRLRRATRRSRRAVQERVIEVAVFVDNEMYRSTAAAGGDTLQRLQDIVFTYLNAVQLLYQSKKLSDRLRLVLVRLDIMKTLNTDINTNSGDIESYLESFCRWQKNENPGSLVKGDESEPGHWDHGLLLTGLNLFDRQPSQDSVIGLAWVSGMCHPDYSCTINEGNNFESVYVIAHEMGHNLGMNHDGETGEGNLCSPDEFLMSPVLGPGKVDWSACSDSELSQFLTGLATRAQAACLDDIPALMDLYDFSSEAQLPGEKFSSMQQCQQAFGSTFRPYLKADSPFEDLCRELWCSNSTHALRAHPALEGTDCSSRPYPYGSTCQLGTCSPFLPAGAASPVPPAVESVPVVEAAPGPAGVDSTDNEVEDTPAWYDPIFTQIFSDLRRKFKEKNPILLTGSGRVAAGVAAGLGAAWQLEPTGCPVECGGGWVAVEPTCRDGDRLVGEEECGVAARPGPARLPCHTAPCSPAIQSQQSQPEITNIQN